MISFRADPPSRKQQNNRTECFRPSNRQTDGETNRQTDRPTDPVTGRLPDRQTPTHTRSHTLTLHTHLLRSVSHLFALLLLLLSLLLLLFRLLLLLLLLWLYYCYDYRSPLLAHTLVKQLSRCRYLILCICMCVCLVYFSIFSIFCGIYSVNL